MVPLLPGGFEAARAELASSDSAPTKTAAMATARNLVLRSLVSTGLPPAAGVGVHIRTSGREDRPAAPQRYTSSRALPPPPHGAQPGLGRAHRRPHPAALVSGYGRGVVARR